jgi:hypothetical protein
MEVFALLVRLKKLRISKFTYKIGILSRTRHKVCRKGDCEMYGIGEALEFLYRVLKRGIFLGIPLLLIGGILIGHYIWR